MKVSTPKLQQSPAKVPAREASLCLPGLNETASSGLWEIEECDVGEILDSFEDNFVAVG